MPDQLWLSVGYDVMNYSLAQQLIKLASAPSLHALAESDFLFACHIKACVCARLSRLRKKYEGSYGIPLSYLILQHVNEKLK